MNEIFDKVLGKVLNFLSYRDRTEYELATALDKYLHKEKVTDEEKVELKKSVLGRVKEMGLVDDEEFAEEYVQNRIKSAKPPGKKLLQAFMYKKGISQDIIKSVLDRYYSKEIERASALVIAEKKFVSLKAGSNSEKKSKLISYLLGRGFSSDAVYAAVDTKFKRE